MSSERLWIVLLALTSFFAGLAGGLLLSMHRFSAETTGTFSEYEKQLTEEFGLTPERTQRLHHILNAYDTDLEALKARHVRDLEPQLVKLGETCRERIRRLVVPEESRADFDGQVDGVELLSLPTERESQSH